MKNLSKLYKLSIYCIIIFYIGYCCYKIIDYISNPIKYEVHSAPWYTGLIIIGAISLILIIINWILLKLNNKKVR